MRLTLLLIGALALGGCDDQSMRHQPRYGANAPAPIFADGAAAQAPPDGALAEDEAALDAASKSPPPVDAALLVRGQERFAIYCAPCHGFGGEGDGVVARRGFPHPPSFFTTALIQAPAQHIFDVISDGYGIMYSYAARVTPRDRWAIVAYVRALQQSRNATLAEAPEAAARLAAPSGKSTP